MKNFSQFSKLYNELKSLNITPKEFETYETLLKSLEYKSCNHIETRKCLDLTYLHLKLTDEIFADLVNNNKDIFANAEAIRLEDHDITNLDCLNICKNLKLIILERNEKLTNTEGLKACKNLEKIQQYGNGF